MRIKFQTTSLRFTATLDLSKVSLETLQNEASFMRLRDFLALYTLQRPEKLGRGHVSSSLLFLVSASWNISVIKRPIIPRLLTP